MTIRMTRYFAVVIACLALASHVQGKDFDVAQARRSVVYIKSFIPKVGTGVGTGFLVSDDGLIYTNRHVIESGNQSHKKSVILVGVASKADPEKLEYFRATVVHVVNEPPSRDFAILKIGARSDYGKFTPLRLATGELQLGDDVAVMGFPFIQEGEPTISFNKGTISSQRVSFGGVSFYQTDAAVNPGNSGGPLFNGEGEVAGIVTLKISGADNIGYALPLKEVLPEIAKVESRIGDILAEEGPLLEGETPDLAELAEADSQAGSGTEARTPEWAQAKPFDPVGRIWTTADGRFTLEATYVTSKDDQVTLRKTDGKVVSVPVNKLSELDRYYVRAMESPWKEEGRLPAPPPGVVKVKTAEVQKIFVREFERDGEELFAKLLKLAVDTRSQDPAAAYACLWEACKTAARSGQFELMFVTLAGLERWYEIDQQLLPMQVEVLKLSAGKATSLVRRATVLGYAVALIDFAIERHDVESGDALLTLSASLAAKLRSGTVLQLIKDRTNRFRAFKRAFQLAEAARERLTTDPTNAPAHLALGRFQVVFDQQWNRASLSHLAQGSDVELAAVARREVAGPTTPKGKVAVADAWWQVANGRSELEATAYKKHAAECYRRCLPDLAALDRTKAEQRIASLGGDEEVDVAGSLASSAGPDRRPSGASSGKFVIGSSARWPAWLNPVSVPRIAEGLPRLGGDFVRTRDTGFLDMDFEFEVVLLMNKDEPIAHIGLGEGRPDPGRHEPKGSVWLRFHAIGQYKGMVGLYNKRPAGGLEVGYVMTEGPHRIKIIKKGDSVRFAVDVDNDGESPDDFERTIPNIRDFADYFHSKNVQLFFGGGGTYQEVSLKILGESASAASPSTTQAAGSSDLKRISGSSALFNYSAALNSPDGLTIQQNSIAWTRKGDTLRKNFRWQVVFKVPDNTALPRNQQVSFGIGEVSADGQLGRRIRLMLEHPKGHGKGAVKLGQLNAEGRFGSNPDRALGVISRPGVHRMTLEKQGDKLTFYVDVDNDGKSPDDLEGTIPNIQDYAPFLHTKNGFLFFGGEATFTHLGYEILR